MARICMCAPKAVANTVSTRKNPNHTHTHANEQRTISRRGDGSSKEDLHNLFYERELLTISKIVGLAKNADRIRFSLFGQEETIFCASSDQREPIQHGGIVQGYCRSSICCSSALQ